MLFNFATIGIFLILAYLFVLGALIFSRIVAPHRPVDRKLTTYECGEPPVGTSWVRFNNRFYIIAIAFILFDVEVVFILPCALLFRQYAGTMTGWFIFAEILVFVFILIAGLAYMWVKGDLSWVKTTRQPTNVGYGSLVTAEGTLIPKGEGALLESESEKECEAQ